jgi:hypothetical protein
MFCRPLYVADYISYDMYALRHYLVLYCAYCYFSEGTTYTLLFRTMVSIQYLNVIKISWAVFEKIFNSFIYLEILYVELQYSHALATHL